MKLDWSDYFIYDEVNGGLIWKHRPADHFSPYRNRAAFWNKRFAGKAAGTPGGEGGRVMTVRLGDERFSTKKMAFKVHRIIWEMMVGPIPEGMVIDHIDGNPSNNLLSNLRACTQTQNVWNTKKTKNKTGYRGVFKSNLGEYYYSKIMVNGKQMYLGCYPTAAEASVVYESASDRYHGEFSLNARPQPQ